MIGAQSVVQEPGIQMPRPYEAGRATGTKTKAKAPGATNLSCRRRKAKGSDPTENPTMVKNRLTYKD